MKFRLILFLFSTLFFSSHFVMANDDKEEVRPEVRLTAAKKTLLEKTQISVIYVKGLVCPSCAIGIRKNLSKMKGVDKKRFKDGIDMNPETQLVTIALKDGAELDNKDLIERVVDAGYVAVEEYRLHESHLDALQFKRDATIEVVHHTHK